MGSGSSASKKKYTQLSDVKASEQGEGAERKALFIGATVRLCGLKAAPELNDCLASVVKFDPSKGRWTVRLETGEEKAVKPENAVVEPIQIGGAVRITGLKKETVLNGMVGIAESYEKSSGRYTVKLSGGVKKAMKASNLVAVVVGPADTRTAEEKRRESEERIHSTGSFHDLEDAPLEIALRSGEIRLVRGSYFRRRFEEGLPWQPREAMREEDFWPPEEASKMWSLWRSNFFIAVSYSWLSSKHSDPNMYHLERLAHVIKNWLEGPPLVLHNRNLSGNKEDEPLPEDVGVFLDFACLHQKKDVSSTAEELQQQAAMKLVGCIYGHEHTTVFRFVAVPVGTQRKYFHRGWTAFETCLAGNKAFQDDKVFTFTEFLDPKVEPPRLAHFWKQHKQQSLPPCSPERFSELLWACEQQVKVFRPPEKVFTDSNDKAFVTTKFRLAWEEQRAIRELEFKNVGWEDAEVTQLASIITSFPKLEALRLTGNKITDAGIEVLMTSLVNSTLRILDLGDNAIGPAGLNSIAAALPSMPALEFLFAFANPCCKDETARWQVTTAWGAVGKDKQCLILDHFALSSQRNAEPASAVIH